MVTGDFEMPLRDLRNPGEIAGLRPAPGNTKASPCIPKYHYFYSKSNNMPTSEILYNGQLRTTATHLQSGTEIQTDAPVDNNGKGEKFSPTDLVATALGSCMLTIMGINAAKNGWNIEGTKISIEKIMGTEPRRIVETKVVFNFPENHGLGEKERTILERAALTCPVAKSLHPDLLQTVTFNW